MVALYDEEELLIIQETWGRFCDKILFAVDERTDQDILKNEARNSNLDEIIPIKTRVADEGAKRKDLWEKVWKFFVELEHRYHGQYDYILRADTDTWFSVNNFKSYAQYFDPALSWNMGHTWYSVWPTVFNSGGNYALSRGANERLVALFESQQFEGRSIMGSVGPQHAKTKHDGTCSKQQIGWAEDVFLGQCLGSLGVFPLDTLNPLGQVRWIPNPSHMKGHWDPYLIASHNHKDKKTRKSVFMELDRKYESERMKDIPVPDKPYTFRIPGNRELRNKDLIYRLK